MPANTTLMQNDSLAILFSKGHDYKSSLVGNEVANEWDGGTTMDKASDGLDSIMRAVTDFIVSLPLVVHIIVCVVLLALLVVVFLRHRKIWGGGYIEDDLALEDNIYEIDYDREMEEARRLDDHAQQVRLVYLRTLRSLDESGRIEWRIYKTPSQYAREMHQSDFNLMTYHFQRVRYGKFDATPSLCEKMESLQEKVLKGGRP